MDFPLSLELKPFIRNVNLRSTFPQKSERGAEKENKKKIDLVFKPFAKIDENGSIVKEEGSLKDSVNSHRKYDEETEELNKSLKKLNKELLLKKNSLLARFVHNG